MAAKGQKAACPMTSVAIVIPSWTGEVSRTLASLERQTFQDYEIEVVKGVSPAGRARNIGVSRTTAPILLFIDDDAFFGSDDSLERLVKLIQSDPQIAVVGSSKLVPPKASRVQKAIAAQVPRQTYPTQPTDTESNPPLEGYGFTGVTTTCCVVRREVFEALGGFDESLTTGPEDTDFFYRVRKAGYRIFVAGQCWVYHDPPASLGQLLRKSFRYGLGYALEVRKTPDRHMALLPLDRWKGRLLLLALPLGFPLALFIHPYFDPHRRLEFGFRPFKTLSTYAVVCGYTYGWYRNKG